MVRTQRERLLLAVALLSIIILSGSLFGQKLYQAWVGMDEEIEALQGNLSKLQVFSQKKTDIQEKYRETQSQLTLNMAQFTEKLNALMSEAGVKYQKLEPQQRPQLEEDFKVLLVDVNEAQATPQQLGTFLYNLEHQSNVMDIEELTITSEGRERGRFGGARSSNTLSLVLQVARLVEYTTAEKLEMTRGRGRPRRR